MNMSFRIGLWSERLGLADERFRTDDDAAFCNDRRFEDFYLSREFVRFA